MKSAKVLQMLCDPVPSLSCLQFLDMLHSVVLQETKGRAQPYMFCVARNSSVAAPAWLLYVTDIVNCSHTKKKDKSKNSAGKGFLFQKLRFGEKLRIGGRGWGPILLGANGFLIFFREIWSERNLQQKMAAQTFQLEKNLPRFFSW